jgi:peroxiredoxin
VGVLIAAVATAGCGGGARPGGAAPPLDLERAQGGGRISLAEFKGAPVLVAFWASWAPPCRLAAEEWGRLYAAHRKAGFTVLAVSAPGDEDGARRSARSLPFPVLLGTEEAARAWLGGADRAYPTAFLVDARGRIAERFVGFQERAVLEPAVKRLLAGS